MKFTATKLNIKNFKYFNLNGCDFFLKKKIDTFKMLLKDFESYYIYMEEIEKTYKLRRNRLRSRIMNKSLSNTMQFIKILQQKGFIQKYYLSIIQLLTQHREIFERVDSDYNAQYNNYYMFYLFSRTNYLFFNLNFILNFVSSLIEPCLQIKVVTLPKFLQKKYKRKFDVAVKHVNPTVRSRYVYKRIILNSSFINERQLYKRLYMCLTTIYLSPGDNLVFLEKINFYKHALKMYKQGSVKLKNV